MIAQNVITATLIGIVITGLLPIIGGIVLLAMHKVKGTSFWAGVLTYIIAIIIYSIIVAVMSIFMLDMVTNNPITFNAISILILGIISAAAMGICIAKCMKKTRTFKGAISCGLGFGVGYSVTSAIGLVSMYSTFAMINSGAYDKSFAAMVEMGAMDKETVNEMKKQFVEFTVTDAWNETLLAVIFAAIFTACAIFIMRGVCAGNTFAGIGAAALVFSAAGGLAAVMPNFAATILVAGAIGLAALIFALRMREKIVPPEAPVIHDSFLDSVAKVQEDTAGSTTDDTSNV